MVQLAKTSGGQWVKTSKGWATWDYYLECCCNDPDCPLCCSQFLLGEFNGNGDLVYTDGNFTVVAIMPTKNKRYVCDGEQVEFQLSVSGYSLSLTEFPWSIHFGRSWEKVTFGTVKAGTTPTDAPGHIEWVTDGDTATVTLTYKHCWADWDEDFGDITLVSYANIPEEQVDISVPACAITKKSGEDCCPCVYECEPCCWYFDCNLPEPRRPELYEDEIAYTKVDSLYGSMLMLKIDLDPAYRRVCREGEAGTTSPPGMGVELLWFPPPDFDGRLGEPVIDFCLHHPGWLSEGPWATACAPTALTAVVDSCHDRTRWPSPDNTYRRENALSLIQCDSDCDYLDPDVITASVYVEYNQAGEMGPRQIGINLELDPVACPNPDQLDCECVRCCTYTGDELVTGLYGTYNDVELTQIGAAPINPGDIGECGDTLFEVPVRLTDQLGGGSYDTTATIELIAPDPAEGCRWLVTIPADPGGAPELAHSGSFVTTADCVGLQAADNPGGTPNGWNQGQFTIVDPDSSALGDNCL